MIIPINIYISSRAHDESLFNSLEAHQSQSEQKPNYQHHEIESLRRLSDGLIENGLKISSLDGFFFGFRIPQIGKEFDLLKMKEDKCLNVELKSTEVSRTQILHQLLRNKHYLKHLGKKLALFSVVTDTMTCYQLSDSNELMTVDFKELAGEIDLFSDRYLNQIDNLFRAADYLVSPLNTPDKFIKGEYFLTQQQEQIKKRLIGKIEQMSGSAFFHITGCPGTGKTLLLYDIAKTLTQFGKVIIIHCGKTTEGQEKLSQAISNLNIVPASVLKFSHFSLSDYDYVLVDESHRVYPNQFEKICEEVKSNSQVCVFSSDPGQILSLAEERYGIVERILKLELTEQFTLSEKIRTNPELHSFIIQMRDINHAPSKPMRYPDVELAYANNINEANAIIEYYRGKGYVFINYSKSNVRYSPYEHYNEDYDTHHVIGQEFDKILMIMDNSFYYDDNGILKGVQHPNPDYLYPNLFYQGITRVREKIALIIVDAPELMKKVASIVDNK